MSRELAQQLAAYGRGGDNTLVHMNPAEVQGLAALGHMFGRNVTVNPYTGLPEAMGLTDILAGLGIGIAAALTGGAAAAAAPALLGVTAGGAGAMAAGAGVGALTSAGLNAGKAAITGEDPGRAAMYGAASGAVSGLGGAANVASDAGSEAAKSAVSTTMDKAGAASSITPSSIANAPAAPAATAEMVPGFSNAASSFAPSSVTPAPTPSGLGGLLNRITDAVPDIGISKDVAQGAAGAVKNSPVFDAFDKSFTALTKDPFNDINKYTMMGNMAIAGAEDRDKQMQAGITAGQDATANMVNQYLSAGVAPSSLPPEIMAQAAKSKKLMTGKPLGMASGGTIAEVLGYRQVDPGYLNQQPMNNFYPQSMIPTAQPMQGSKPVHNEVLSRAYGGPVGYGYAEGGATAHGSEGLLHGPGDGQSDGIASLIHGKEGTEPVRLADGEFIIPADVVAALGAGSTKAGSSALYAMMDRIRQQAYGHTNQMNPVDHNKVMPA